MKSPLLNTTSLNNYIHYNIKTTPNNPPKFNITTEPHYKIRNYIEQENTYIPNKNLLKKIITTAINKQKYQGKMNLNNPGNKDVLTDSDSEEYYNINDSNMKYINKKILKQNGCAKLIIKKIESQAPQKNEEYYNFNNNNNYNKNYNNNYYKKKDPLYSLYASKTLSNFSFKINNNRNNKDMIYMKTNPNEKINEYNNKKNSINNSDSKINDNNNNNYINFNSNMDLNNIIFNKKINIKQNINDSYESSEDAEYGSSSYIYYPTKIKKNFNNNNRNNVVINKKENDFSTQSLSYNDDYNNNKKKEEKKKLRRAKILNKKDETDKPSLRQLININYNNNGTSILQKKFNDKLIKNVIKIQSIWKGYYTREIIIKNYKLIKFISFLIDIIYNKYLEYIEEFFNIIKYMKKQKNYKIESEKKENYDDLLKDYNLLLNKYDKLEKEMNELKLIHNKKNNSFDNLNIVKDENNFEILDIIIDNKKEINNFNKIFEIIEQEKNDEFSIIKKEENNIIKPRQNKNNYKLREKNNNKIINSEYFMIKENKKLLNKNLNYIEKYQSFEIKGKKQKRNPEIKNKFKNDDLIIVKKSKFNIIKKVKENIEKVITKNLIQSYIIDKNTLCIKRFKNKEKNKNNNNINDNPTKIEIDKNESLEINPYEIKKYSLNNKSFKERAKNNILRMMLPIKLKAIINKKVKQEIFKGLKIYKN